MSPLCQVYNPYICQYVCMLKELPVREIDSRACCTEPEGPALQEDEAAGLARGFAALADPARLRLYSLIASQPGEVCACSLVDPVGRSQPTVSHHLKVLYEAGLVERQRRGSWIWYRAVPARLAELVAPLTPSTG